MAALGASDFVYAWLGDTVLGLALADGGRVTYGACPGHVGKSGSGKGFDGILSRAGGLLGLGVGSPGRLEVG